MNTSYVLCVVMVLLAVARVTECCECVGGLTIKDYLDSSDFAVKAMVSNWTLDHNNSRTTIFTVRILETYKMPSTYMAETTVEIHSYADSAACGRNPGRDKAPGLETGPFFITANVEDGRLLTTMCSNTVREWKSLSGTEKATILNFLYPNVATRGSGEGGCLQVMTSMLAVTLFYLI